MTRMPHFYKCLLLTCSILLKLLMLPILNFPILLGRGIGQGIKQGQNYAVNCKPCIIGKFCKFHEFRLVLQNETRNFGCQIPPDYSGYFNLTLKAYNFIVLRIRFQLKTNPPELDSLNIFLTVSEMAAH